MRTELILIFLVIGAIFALTAIRYRRQIGAIYSFWKMLKQARIETRQNADELGNNERAAGPLVNCSKCGTWIPESRAIKLGARLFFCSADCVEKSAKTS
jgi:hypothetical protein